MNINVCVKKQNESFPVENIQLLKILIISLEAQDVHAGPTG